MEEKNHAPADLIEQEDNHDEDSSGSEDQDYVDAGAVEIDDAEEFVPLRKERPCFPRIQDGPSANTRSHLRAAGRGQPQPPNGARPIGLFCRLRSNKSRAPANNGMYLCNP